jgi:hypothetical protein
MTTFDEGTAGQLYLHGNRHDKGDTLARGSLPRPSWGTSWWRTKRTSMFFTLKMEAIRSSEKSDLSRTTRRRHMTEETILHVTAAKT